MKMSPSKTPDLPKSLPLMIMTSSNGRPILWTPTDASDELTMEQEFNVETNGTDLLPEADKEDIITVFLALQKQNYCLSNTIKNLLKEWPIPPTYYRRGGSKFGILFEIKDFPST